MVRKESELYSSGALRAAGQRFLTCVTAGRPAFTDVSASDRFTSRWEICLGKSPASRGGKIPRDCPGFCSGQSPPWLGRARRPDRIAYRYCDLTLTCGGPRLHRAARQPLPRFGRFAAKWRVHCTRSPLPVKWRAIGPILGGGVIRELDLIGST